MAYKSITRRWMVGNFLLIVSLLAIVTMVAAVSIHEYYYNAVERALDMRAQSTMEKIQEIKLRPTNQVSAQIRTLVQQFRAKDKMEMMAVGHEGQILATSSGFSKRADLDEMNDFVVAKEALDGKGFAVYRMPATNEKVMALSVLLPLVSNNTAAVRYVTSIEDIDQTIVVVIALICGIMLLIVGGILVTSSYFIRSIVIPVQQVGVIARRFATGDMSERMITKTEDEIGELCNVINYMADEMENSEKLKNEFISSVSHELRTPLTAIKGWGETLAGEDGSNDSGLFQKGMRVIISETERLANMVEELLDFSRMQSGKFVLVKTKMDLLAELEDSILVYTERARREQINFIYHLPEQLPYIMGDRNRIKQVFINVLDNAMKYSKAGDCVTVNALEVANKQLLVGISDTGCGIDEKDLSSVTRKFYKANLTQRGSGIGLAVVDEIIAMHDGTLTITSKLGEGTTVQIQFPSVETPELS